MKPLRAWTRRVAGLFTGARSDRELAQEIEEHLRLHAEDYQRAGLAPDEARRQAVLAFGGIQRVTEQYRDRRSVPLVESTLQDGRTGARISRTHTSAELADYIHVQCALVSRRTRTRAIDRGERRPGTCRQAPLRVSAGLPRGSDREAHSSLRFRPLSVSPVVWSWRSPPDWSRPTGTRG